MNIMSKRLTAGVVVAAMSCGIGASAAQAASASTTPTSSISAPTSQRLPGGLTAQDWRDVARQAAAAGDAEGVEIATTMAENAAAQQGTVAKPHNIFTTIAKKALVKVLRYGASKLPAKVRPYASKIANVIEHMEDFQVAPIQLALMKAGIPADVAHTAALWCVTFLGV